MPNVPDRYCRKVFADYTGNVEFGLDEYSSEFMDESHSVDSAEETLAFKLLQKQRSNAAGEVTTGSTTMRPLNTMRWRSG